MSIKAFSIDEGKVVLYVIENDIEDMTRIVAHGAESGQLLFGRRGRLLWWASFNVDNDASWNMDNIWAAAFVQLPSGSIFAGSEHTSPARKPGKSGGRLLTYTSPKMSREAHYSPTFYLYNIGPANKL